MSFGLFVSEPIRNNLKRFLKELAELTCCVIVIADLLADSFGLGKTTNFKPKLFSTAGVNLASKDIIPKITSLYVCKVDDRA